MREYNAVFDKMTLVVGKHHLHNALDTIPDWWGDNTGKTDFQTIRSSFMRYELTGKIPLKMASQWLGYYGEQRH